MPGERFWLEDRDGRRIRVGPGGVLLGRDDRCDVVTRDERASRRHALVLPGEEGLQLCPLGKNPTTVNGAPKTKPVPLKPGDRIAIPGCSLQIGTDPAEPAPEGWLLEVSGGGVYRVHCSPFQLGGGTDDDLRLPGAEPDALRLHLARGSLFAEEDGEMRRLRGSEELEVGDHIVRVIPAGSASATTVVEASDELPSAAEFQFLPRGGRLTLHFDGDTRTVWLSELRADLIALLLNPPGDLKAGDYIEDTNIISAVWPRRSDRGQSDLNSLVFWVRKTLVRSGIDGVSLLERAPQGGATRICLRPGATAQILMD